MNVVQRAVPWKRLMVTFLQSFAIVFVYNIVAGGLLVLWAISLGGDRGDKTIGIVILSVLLILYVVGFMYITIAWHLASVVSVLEDCSGMKQMMKSKNLIKGIAIAVFFTLGIRFISIQVLYESFVVLGWPDLSMEVRIGIGILCFFLLFRVVLFGLVIQITLYSLYKSYRHQYIDKSSLAGHVESYIGEYVRSDSRAVQTEQTHV